MSLFALRRPVMSRTVYLIIFALYVGLLLNLAFYRQVFTLLPVNGLHNWLVFLSMPVVACSVMNILTTLASFLRLDRLVIVCLFCSAPRPSILSGPSASSSTAP